MSDEFDPKDPSDVAWYEIDLSGVVGDDPVATVTCSPVGVTMVSDDVVGNTYLIKLSAGTAGTTAKLPLLITTTGGQTFERTVKLKVKQR